MGRVGPGKNIQPDDLPISNLSPAFPESEGRTGAATSLLLTDLGCLLGSVMLAKGLPSPTSSTVSKPRLSAVLLGEGEPCQRQSDSASRCRGEEETGGRKEESAQRLQSRTGCS